MAVSFSGSLDISGSLSTTGTITMSGSIASASFATTASYVVSSVTDATQNSRIAANEAKTGSYATTGSNSFYGNQSIIGSGNGIVFNPGSGGASIKQLSDNNIQTLVIDRQVTLTKQSGLEVTGSLLVSGDATATGTITAQTLVVQTITSSVDFVTGSTKFGSTTGNTHQFTGSVLVSGSQTVNGTFTVNTPSSATALALLGRSADNYSALRYQSSNGTATYATIYSNASDLIFENSGSERMRITSGGALQINGVSSTAVIQTNSDNNILVLVASTALVDNKPRIELGGTGYVNANTNFYRAGTQIFTSAYASTEYMRINSDGNIGIGVTSLGSWDSTIKALEIGTKGNFYGGYNGGASVIYLGANAYYNSGWKYATSLSYKAQLLDAGGGNWHFQNAAAGTAGNAISWTSLMYIKDNGNVGIGVTSPKEKLEITGYDSQNIRIYGRGGISYNSISSNLYYNGSSWVRDNGSNGASEIGFGAASDYIYFTTTSSTTGSPSERMRITSGGNVGIGTTSPNLTTTNRTTLDINGTSSSLLGLSVGGNARAYLYHSGTNFAIANYANGGNLDFNTYGADGDNTRMRISSTGAITRPYQPFFYGGLSGDQSISATTFTTLNFLSTQGFYGLNTGGYWNNSTYGFTAPVTGIYLVTLSLYTNTVGQVALHVNGTRKHSIPAGYYPSGTITYGGSAMIPLTAGEVLTLQGYGSGSGVVYANQYHTWAAIYLL